jgi:hypothetical protein
MRITLTVVGCAGLLFSSSLRCGAGEQLALEDNTKESDLSLTISEHTLLDVTDFGASSRC